MECPTCGGTGMIGYTSIIQGEYVFTDEECFVCKGTGEMPDQSQAYGTDCPRGGCE